MLNFSLKIKLGILLKKVQLQESLASAAGGRRAVAPPPGFQTWYFSVSFAIFQSFFAIFGLFSVAPSPPGRGLIVLFCDLFCYFSVFFSVSPPLPLKIFLPMPLARIRFDLSFHSTSIERCSLTLWQLASGELLNILLFWYEYKRIIFH